MCHVMPCNLEQKGMAPDYGNGTSLSDRMTGCVDCQSCLQAVQDKSIGTEEFISCGLLSLCLRSLAAQDSGLRYEL